MGDPHRSAGGKRPSGAEDFVWGHADGHVQVGIWPARASVEEGRSVNLRTAVRNRSDAPVTLGSDFSLVVRHGGDRTEQRSGPRPDEPLHIDAGGFQEILGWRLGTDRLDAGVHTVRVVYRTPGGQEIRSGEMHLEIHAAADP